MTNDYKLTNDTTSDQHYGRKTYTTKTSFYFWLSLCSKQKIFYMIISGYFNKLKYNTIVYKFLLDVS